MKNRLFIFFCCSVMPFLGLWAQTISPNIQIHPNPTTFQFEPSIITHPSNPNIVFASAVALINGMRIGWYYSTDAGLTWTGRDTLPTHAVLSTKMNDPTTGIDLDGSLFVSGILGSTIIVVARSTDGGGNWTQQPVAYAGLADKPHMVIDRNPDSPYKNYIYVAYNDNSTNPHPPLFVRSTDHGQNFSPSISVGGAAGSTIGVNGGVGPNLAVGPDSMLYVTWTGFDSAPWINPLDWHLGFNKSSDGGVTWGTPEEIGGRLIKYNGGAQGVSFFNFPSMVVDASSGPRRGWIYIVYAELNSSAPDIFLIRSSDRGESWSSPLKVNQDTDTARIQWQPWVSVDPATGNLFVVYYDGRNSPGNDSAEVYLSASVDGGETFIEFPMSDVPFHPTATFFATVVPNYMGSYIGVTALRDTVWTVWNDNRSGLFLQSTPLHQIYASRMVFSPASGPKGILSARSIAFGAVNPGSFKDTTFVITNYGDDTLKVSNIVSSDPEFTVRTSSMDIPPGKSFTDTIRYTPSFSATLLATLVISSNNPSSDTINVSGGDPATGVERVSSEIPAALALAQNYPNPFNPSTVIGFRLQASGFTSLKVFDLLGREVATLVNEELSPGIYEVPWDATGFASGIYFYTLSSGGFTETKRLLLLR